MGPRVPSEHRTPQALLGTQRAAPSGFSLGSVSPGPCLPPQAPASASAPSSLVWLSPASGPLNLLFPLLGKRLLLLRPLQSPGTSSSNLYSRQPLGMGPPCWHTLGVPVEDRWSEERWGCSEHQLGRGAGLGLACPEGRALLPEDHLPRHPGESGQALSWGVGRRRPRPHKGAAGPRPGPGLAEGSA